MHTLVHYFFLNHIHSSIVFVPILDLQVEQMGLKLLILEGPAFSGTI